MGIGIGAARETTNDGEALGGEFESQPLRHPPARIAGGARANDGHALRVVNR